MNKEELLEILSCIDHLTYCNREVEREKLIEIIEDLYEDECYDLDFLCFLAVLTDTEYEQLEEIFEEVEFYA